VRGTRHDLLHGGGHVGVVDLGHGVIRSRPHEAS
jgi:hypothetical protein